MLQGSFQEAEILVALCNAYRNYKAPPLNLFALQRGDQLLLVEHRPGHAEILGQIIGYLSTGPDEYEMRQRIQMFVALRRRIDEEIFNFNRLILWTLQRNDHFAKPENVYSLKTGEIVIVIPI